jgi:DNA-binding NarL/FixJ family response regulator
MDNIVCEIKSVKNVKTVADYTQLADNIKENNPDFIIADIYSRNYGSDLLEILTSNYSPDGLILHTTRENKHLNYYNSVLRISHFVYAEDSVEQIRYSIEKIFNGMNGLMSSDYNGLLTNRECEVLRLIALGKTSKEIAEQLCISKNTVDTHRNKMLQKLNIANSASLVQFAYNTGLI